MSIVYIMVECLERNLKLPELAAAWSPGDTPSPWPRFSRSSALDAKSGTSDDIVAPSGSSCCEQGGKGFLGGWRYWSTVRGFVENKSWPFQLYSMQFCTNYINLFRRGTSQVMFILWFCSSPSSSLKLKPLPSMSFASCSPWISEVQSNECFAAHSKAASTIFLGFQFLDAHGTSWYIV